MKKSLPVIIVVLAVGAILYSFFGGASSSKNTSTETVASDGSVPGGGGAPAGGKVNGMAPGEEVNGQEEDGSPDDADQGEVRPASEMYKSSQEALDAIKKAAIDYDDVVLEQFMQPGEDCTWCPEFYRSVTDMMKAGDVKPEERSYFAELLAISGRVENISSLIDAMKSASKTEDKELYAEALELTVGKDDIVEYLGKQLSTDNAELKDALVAAITNQGSPLAIDTLYKNTVESGDPDGYYSQGIGLGEVIPDEESLPALREVVSKRDQFSHLGVKAMLNSGLTGLRQVMDILANSTDPDFDRKMLKDAVDHVNYEEDTDRYLKELQANSKSPLVQEFAKQIIDDFNSQAEEDTSGGEEPISSEGAPVQMDQ